MGSDNELIPLRARAMQFLHTGVVITDAKLPDNPIIDCNPAFEILTGYPAKEALGKNCRFLQRDDADVAVLDIIRQAVKDKRLVTVIIKNYRKDGSMFWNELTISPVFDDNNELTHYIGIQNDVTVRETARLELSQENADLLHMNFVLAQKNQQQKNIDDRINDLLNQSHSL